MAQITRVGVDIAKSVFHVHGVDRADRQQWSAKLTRAQWLNAVSDRVPQGALIILEGCGSAHHWARELQRRGYTVRLIAAQFVKPFVKSNKNDRLDAEAICEAGARPSMRFARVKSVQQQDQQATHRIREERIKQRTALANQIRGLVGEYGIVAPKGLAQLRRALPDWLEDAENGLSEHFRCELADLYADLQGLDERVKQQDQRIARRVQQDPMVQRLLALRGVGPLAATALASALGDGSGYRRGRDFAASLGLTPRQHSSGGKARLLGISKRGDTYLRKLLIHGARAVIYRAAHRDDRLSRWVNALVARKPVNVAAVALANKTARMAWALAHGEQDYDPTLAAAGTA